MVNAEQQLKNTSRAMKVVGWLCLVVLPASAVFYPPGVWWGSVPDDFWLPVLVDHLPSPYHGLHPYAFMLLVLYASFGFLMLRGARDPQRHVALFDYGIAANILHGGIMIPMAFIYPNEHAHLWADIPFAAVVVFLCYKWHPDKIGQAA
jgi:hypothetical protein